MIAKVVVWKINKKTKKSKKWYFRINDYSADELHFDFIRDKFDATQYLINHRDEWFPGFTHLEIDGERYKI